MCCHIIYFNKAIFKISDLTSYLTETGQMKIGLATISAEYQHQVSREST
jgi:hypothetical protein